ncbi:immunoglobulin superfamily containing leucine-rich repeat protein 2-like [Anoplophora glabripennis]|uniref:immunoglobulin superfamily containing leucine-rich repeat protein 2-like n=1 Tax=Anoplophora glabripennis TaxID=217634 RepID=UPI000C77D1FD|nr:immunoglobulin superfamily containing leucine-rich repeat protein 2-like [Anoplophora glabripennis]
MCGTRNTKIRVAERPGSKVNENLLRIYTFLICSILADEIYENSKDICERCKCRDEDEFLLDCTDQGFKYILANWPAHNKTLVATFSYNNITTLEILPPTNQTVRLVFDHCNIKYLDPGAFKEVKNVEFIDLSYNLLTTEEIDGEDFKGPYNKSVYCPIAVKHLNLAYNQIHSLPRKFFESMPYLEELNLAGNDFVTLDPNTQMALATLPNLRVSLRWNSFHSVFRQNQGGKGYEPRVDLITYLKSIGDFPGLRQPCAHVVGIEAPRAPATNLHKTRWFTAKCIKVHREPARVGVYGLVV